MKKNKYILPLLLTIAMVSGCGQTEEEVDPVLTSFRENLTSFEAAISEIDTSINAIDSSDESAIDSLLGYYDALDAQFQELTTYEVPEEFSAIDTLADMASQYMTQAVIHYHSAFENEPLNQTVLDTANTYYSYAITYVNYIGQVLTGATVEFVNSSDTTDTTTDETVTE